MVCVNITPSIKLCWLCGAMIGGSSESGTSFMLRCCVTTNQDGTMELHPLLLFILCCVTIHLIFRVKGPKFFVNLFIMFSPGVCNNKEVCFHLCINHVCKEYLDELLSFRVKN